jgi:hypothetical protein
MRAFVPLVLAVACGCPSEKAGSLRARLVLQPHDTMQFIAGAWIWRCGGGRGLVLKGVDGGNGLLLWLRPGDSTLDGEYRVIGRGDTIASRGVVGAVRFLVQATDRGVTLDSGVVTVSSTSGRFEAHARGSGLDSRAGQRVVLDASFGAVPMAADTVDCRVQL